LRDEEIGMSIDSHEVAERSRLLSHRLYAERLRDCPALIDQARDQIEESVRNGVATVGECLWHHVLQQSLDDVVGHMVRDDEGGRLLRSNSPFSRIIGVRDPELRSRLWRQAKIELSARTTSGARSAA
jgi:hypothetical protein